MFIIPYENETEKKNNNKYIALMNVVKLLSFNLIFFSSLFCILKELTVMKRRD